MEFGLSFPQRDIGNDPAVIRDFVQTAEELGFAKLTIIDHVLQSPTVTVEDDPEWFARYTLENGFHEPMTLLAHVAAITSRITLVTANIILPQRQTALVAKQAAELDLLSGGRLILGVGLGWNEVEYQALGMNFADRGRRIEEQVELLRRLWTEPLVSFHGNWHSFENAGLNPGPVQKPIPIWFGAVVDAAIRRAARLGDGFLGFPNLAPGDEARQKFEVFRSAARDAGRDADSIPIDATVYARDGGPDDWRSCAAEWIGMGATHVTFRTSDCGFTTVDEHIDAMRRLLQG